MEKKDKNYSKFNGVGVFMLTKKRIRIEISAHEL